MELNDIFKKLDEIDQKYSDTSKVSEKACKDLGEQQLKFAQELAKVSAADRAHHGIRKGYRGLSPGIPGHGELHGRLRLPAPLCHRGGMDREVRGRQGP